MAGQLVRPSLVFIGMPSSGKTTIGRLTADILGLPFVDFDELLELRSGMSVREIFALRGEPWFRQLETSLCIELSRRGGLVISPGGGIVEREKNMSYLMPNNICCLLKRDSSLIDRRGRPLLADPDSVSKLLARRGPLYNRYAQFTLDNNSTPLSCALSAAEIYKNY